MTTTGLRRALDATAERSRTAAVTPDTFRRGRRAHRRGVALRAVAAVAAIAGAGALLLVPGGDGAAPPAATAGAPAFPTEIYEVPEGPFARAGNGQVAAPLEKDLAVGRASVAFPTQSGAPIVVSATDGGYHALDLPRFEIVGLHTGDGPLFTLSPSGRTLFYSWFELAARDRDAASVPSGIARLDLGTGTVTFATTTARRDPGVADRRVAQRPLGVVRHLRGRPQPELQRLSQGTAPGGRDHAVPADAPVC
ncbi:MAG: hypothetical protein ABJA93_13550 [Sporichthyaceae bacterium]